jgi:hypothetical protein
MVITHLAWAILNGTINKETAIKSLMEDGYSRTDAETAINNAMGK